MNSFRVTWSTLIWVSFVFWFSPSVNADNVEDTLGRHMVAEALLAAHFVAAAERSGMDRDEINAILRGIAEKSAVDEFWITDSNGHAYLTNTGVDFAFDPDPSKQPQASAFWPLISGKTEIVIQAARKREIDDQVYKYVAVAGIDRPRIVQVGIRANELPACN